MHPNIKLPKCGQCPICFMDLIPLETGAQEEGERVLAMSETAKALADIKTTKAERKFVEAEIRMVGKVDYDETRLAYLTAWVPGRLDRLYVDYTGVPVKKGEHLVYLYSPELYAAQEELLQAVRAAKELKHSDLAGIRKSTEATVEAARERLRQWGLTGEQVAQVERSGKPDDHVTIYAPLGGIVIHKNGFEGMYVQTGTRIYTIADLGQVWVKLDAYESDLTWIRYGQQVEFTTQAYPSRQFVGSVAFIDPMLDSRTRTVKVRLNVDNADGVLKPGMFVRAVLRSKLTGGGHVLAPELAGKWMCSMHPEVVKDTADECDRCQMPLVRAETLGLTGLTKRSVPPLVVPATAPLLTGKRAVVYVKLPGKEKPTFVGREVLLGPRAGDHYLVEEGLKEGDLVVTNGAFKIDSALQIQAKPSMMSADTDAELKQPDPVTNTLCPVMGHAVDPEVFVEYQGKKVYFCCRGCDKKFLASPERYLGKLPQFALAAPAAPKVDEAVPREFGDQLGAVVRAYLTVQKALAGDDPAGAKKGAGAVQTALAAVDVKLLKGAAHHEWMQEQAALSKASSLLAAGEAIAGQREAFALLSESLTVALKRFDCTTKQPIALFHCSMAFNNRGASWLQDSEDTLNPYFGASMLKCGTKKQTIIERGK